MKIAIDPGHGMSNRDYGIYDPGATAAGVTEADVALLWALTLKHVMVKNGIETFLTRDDGSDHTPVSRRAQRAKEARCTHLISIHCNASLNPLASGTETFYRDNGDLAWANWIQQAGMASMQGKDRGLKLESQSQHKRLAVLGFTPPAALLEIGFISNKGDRQKMLEVQRRIAFAEALVRRIS